MNFDTVPAWAHNACYYILAMVGILLAMSIWKVVQLYMMTKSATLTGIAALGSLITLSIVGFMLMMNFWIV